jgi:hypothetical protein
VDATQAILLVCEAGGLVIVLGCIWLLAKQIIHLDSESKKVTTDLDMFGIKLKTATPVIVLFVLGTGLLIYSAKKASEHSKELSEQEASVAVRGDVSGDNHGVSCYAALVSASLPGPGPFGFTVPKLHPNKTYMLLYLVDGQIVGHQMFDPQTDGNKPLTQIEINSRGETILAGDIPPRPAGY